MSTSDARIAANRLNAQKSTGPKTDEGKARSRRNALRHGFAGSGVAWPHEVQAELDDFVRVHVELHRPQDEHEAFLASRSATLAWQINRAERVEAANAHGRSARGRADELKRRSDEVAALAKRVETEEDPARAIQDLRRTPEGCDWLLSALRELIDAVARDWWGCLLNDRVDALCKDPQPSLLKISRAKALGIALAGGEPPAVWPDDIPGLPAFPIDKTVADLPDWYDQIRRAGTTHRAEWRAELKAILEERVAEIELIREELTADGDPGLELADVVAAFDTSKEGECLRRYLRSLVRERRAVLREIQEWRAERAERQALPALDYAIPDAPPVPTPEPEPVPETPPDAVQDEGEPMRTYVQNAARRTTASDPGWVRSAGDRGATQPGANPDRPPSHPGLARSLA